MAFQNRVAVITGASSGIGWALARQLAAAGARVGLVARRQDKLEALATEIRQAGGTAAWAVADVASWKQTQNAMEAIRKELGPIDLLIANAGISESCPVDPPNTERVAYMFQVNVIGMIHAIDAVLPEMLQRGTGHIAGVASIAAYKGIPGEHGYAATKAAMYSYLDGLRVQLRKRGIAVTTLCPGFISTPMIDDKTWPKPFLMTADQAASKMLYAIRKRKKVYNFPRPTRFMMRVLGWLPDRWVHRIFRKYTIKG